MLNHLQRDKPGTLIEAKVAIRRLMEVYKRVETLTANKFRINVNKQGSASIRKSYKEGIEHEIRNLYEGLAAILKTEKRRQESFADVQEMARRFEESNSIEEISSLIGLTLLSDYQGHASGVNLIQDVCKNKIYPSIPVLADLMQSALELDKVCEWTHKILGYDPEKGEDDIIRMVSAIQSLDLGRFDRIYQALDQRLKVEETRESQLD